MKKLMIAAAIVCAAVAAQAATFDWKTSATGKLYNENDTDTYTGTAYLFSTGDMTQQQVLSAWAAGTLSTGDALATKSISAGKIALTPTFNWGNAGDDLTAFVVVDDGSKIFISGTQTQVGDLAETVTFSFALKDGSTVAATEFETPTFAGQGWYTPAAVPEPTSGLLLLLGVAGMALRRRRA